MDGLRDIEKLRQNRIIIYGIGTVGNLVRQYCEIMGLSTNIIAFVVTKNKPDNEFHGYRLTYIDDLKEYMNESEVIIATYPDSQKDIEEELKKHGFYRIVKVNFETYDIMTRLYISKFLERKIYKRVYDIIYMASDNNCTSGAFLCLIDLVKDMNWKGLRTLVVLPEYGNGEELLIKAGIDYTYVTSKTWLQRIDEKKLSWQERSKVNNAKAIKVIERLIEKYSVKVVHCNTTYTNIGAIAAHNKRIPVVWHLRERISEQGYGYKNEKQFYNLINDSDKIITVSMYLRKGYPKLDPRKTVTIYDGIEIERYYFEKKIFVDKTINILMPAAIYSLKRQEDLIKAIGILKRRKIHICAKFAGTGEKEYLSKLEMLVRYNNLKDNVKFLGRRDDIEEYYRWADIVISCSGVESFGRVCIEGALAGCLVIGANSGGTAEVIHNKETGLLYEYKNSYDLAQKIEFAINHPEEMRYMAYQGQRRARDLFSKENCSNKVYEIYKSL